MTNLFTYVDYNRESFSFRKKAKAALIYTLLISEGSVFTNSNAVCKIRRAWSWRSFISLMLLSIHEQNKGAHIVIAYRLQPYLLTYVLALDTGIYHKSVRSLYVSYVLRALWNDDDGLDGGSPKTAAASRPLELLLLLIARVFQKRNERNQQSPM